MDMNSAKKSLGISFVTQYLELALHFLAVLILARILSPADIGVYSVAAFLMTLLHVFRDFGVVQYLIQEHELTREKIRSAMGVAIILALTVALVLYSTSGLLARFYGNPDIQEVLTIMAASFAISPFGSLLLGVFRREMKFKEIFYIRISSALCHVVTAVALALQGMGAQSLAWANFVGILSFGIVATVLRPRDMPWLPSFTNIKTILSFGGVASLGNAANNAGTNIADLVIGKVISMAAVGYFSRANGLVQLFTKLIAGAVLPVVLPYFSQMRRDGKELAESYIAAVSYITALAFPFFATLMLLAYPVVRTLYGAQWDASVPIVELLCIAGAISSISTFAGQAMVANGEVKNSTYSQLLSQPFRIGAVLYAAAHGLIAIAIALVAAELVALLIFSWFLNRTIKVNFLAILKACRKSLAVTCCTAIVPLFLNLSWTMDVSNSWIPMVLGGLGAAGGWLAGIVLVKHPLGDHFLPYVTRFLGIVLGHGLEVEAHRKDMKFLLKDQAYRRGIMGAYHRIRNRNRLTVAMFHRVLPAHDTRYAGADPEWTMTPESFTHCLEFFRKHYHDASPDEVFASLRGEKKLPKRSLLLTFDDGWADTAEFAQPILDKFGMPSLIFVAGGAINQAMPFWEERLYSFMATNPGAIEYLADRPELAAMQIDWPVLGDIDEARIKNIIQRIGKLPRETVVGLVESLPAGPESAISSMMGVEQLARLVAGSHRIGGHGMTHQPLTTVVDVEEELKRSRAAIAPYMEGRSVDAMSFPHGAYSNHIIGRCRAVGYKYLFSSEAFLNRLSHESNLMRPVGRIHISERAITDKAGRFQPALLATSLFLRPSKSLGANEE